MASISHNFAIQQYGRSEVNLRISKATSNHNHGKFSDENTVRWADVDILHPPPLSDLTIEALRLNELLASAAEDAKGACLKKKRYGSDADAFTVCQDNHFSIANKLDESGKKTKAFLLTNRERVRGIFENSLNIPHWIVYAPKRSNIFELLVVDLEVNNLPMSDKNPDEYGVPMQEIKSEFQRQQFAAAKIDFVDADGQPSHSLIPEILSTIQSEQIFIVVHLERRNPNIVFQWYSSLFDIISKGNFVLLHAESSGACGADLEHFGNCEYRITLVDREKVKQHPRMAATFGLKSPAEEKYRLLNYLINARENGCTSADSFDQVPVSCITAEDNQISARKCTSLIYIRYRNFPDQQMWDEMASKMVSACAEFHVFYPHKINTSIRIPSSVTLHPFGISTKNISEKFSANIFEDNDVWQLEPLKELLNRAQLRTYTLNRLVFDLDGGEWTLLDNLLRISPLNSFCTLLRNFERVIFRLRIWMSEEAKNFRKLYSNMVLLEKECEFSKIHAITYDASTYGIIFARKNIIL